MKIRRRAATPVILACAGLAPLAVQAATSCEVIPDSMKEFPASVGNPHYTKGLVPAHDVRLKVTVGPDGRATEVAVESSQDPEPARRSALLWRYQCQDKQGGVAEWVLHHPEQQCKLNITSKNFNPTRYPPKAFRAGIQGKALLGLQPQGDRQLARRVYIAQSSGSAVLDQAALEAGMKWSFDCNGPVDDTEPAQDVPVHFSLD